MGDSVPTGSRVQYPGSPKGGLATDFYATRLKKSQESAQGRTPSGRPYMKKDKDKNCAEAKM